MKAAIRAEARGCPARVRVADGGVRLDRMGVADAIGKVLSDRVRPMKRKTRMDRTTEHG
jgi:hypothetical protein